MIKEAVIHHLSFLKELHPLEFEDIDTEGIELYLDVTTQSREIREIIGTNKSKFKLILYTILSGEYNDDLYKKEAEGVYAMRFSKPNSRIYCREIHGVREKKKIIMSRSMLNKTSQKNNKTNGPIIEALQEYEFKYFTKYEETERYKNSQKRLH
jgi:hypothetical protein